LLEVIDERRYIDRRKYGYRGYLYLVNRIQFFELETLLISRRILRDFTTVNFSAFAFKLRLNYFYTDDISCAGATCSTRISGVFLVGDQACEVSITMAHDLVRLLATKDVKDESDLSPIRLNHEACRASQCHMAQLLF